MCCLPGVRPPTGPATGLVLARGMKKFLSQVSSHQPIVAIVAIVTIVAAPGSGTLFSLSQSAEECLCFANCSAEPGRAGVKPGELQPAPRPRLVPAAGMGRRDLSEY